MKLSNVLKVFGAAALLGSLVPYRVTTDEDTGEKKYRALLWEAIRAPQDDGAEKNLSVHVGFFNPLSDDEAHMYADDLTVEYIPDEEDVPADEPADETEMEPEETAEEIVEEAVEDAAEEITEEAAGTESTAVPEEEPEESEEL